MDFRAKTPKKKWTPQEEQMVFNLKKRGYTTQQISQITHRSIPSIKNKIRRKRKQKGLGEYDAGHTMQKHLINQHFIKQIQPETILDLYNGGSTQYNNYKTVTNDINPAFNTNYHEDSLELIQKFYNKNKHFDFIDLDPFGAVAPLIKYAIPLADKAIALTFGEFCHKRFKRIKIVQKYYNITKYEHFNLKHINNYLIRYAQETHNKKLIPIYAKDWNHICRIWYKIEK